MKRLFTSSMIALLALLAVLATACGGSGPGPAASTATPLPPTATLVPPSPTAVPATDTPAPTATSATSAPSGGGAAGGTETTTTGGNTGGGATGSLADALAKAKDATAYRMELTMTGSGSLGLDALLSGGTPAAESTPATGGSAQDVPLISMKGEVNGKDTHITMQGLLAAFLGVDPNKGLELITVGGKSYVHGPAALLGATEDKWYELPADQASAAQPPLKPSTLLESFTSSGMNPSDFKKSGTESLDNQTCDVYSGDKDTVMKAFQSASQSTGQSQSFETLDTAELKFWVCNDGYFHQMRMFVQGSTKEKPDQKGSFLILMHLSDIGANITITAPPSAEPLNNPFGLGGTATPTP